MSAMIPCPDDNAVTERRPEGSHTGAPGGAHALQGHLSTVTVPGQPPSAPPASGECPCVTIVSVLRWMTP